MQSFENRRKLQTAPTVREVTPTVNLSLVDVALPSVSFEPPPLKKTDRSYKPIWDNYMSGWKRFLRPLNFEIRTNCSLYKKLGVDNFLHEVAPKLNRPAASQKEVFANHLKFGIFNEVISAAVTIVGSGLIAFSISTGSKRDLLAATLSTLFVGIYPLMGARLQRMNLYRIAHKERVN